MIEGFRRSYEAPQHGWALLPLRLIVGYGFMAHGIAKWSRGPEHFGQLLQQIGVPMPVATAWIVTLLEVFGGLAILLGVLVAVASIPLIASMLVAMFTVQLRYGFSSVNTIGLTEAGPVFGPPGYEINLLYIASLVALALLGAGPFSVGRWVAERKATRSDRASADA
ncbi:MAG TPA: DoxX family protein [Gemmatimonadaceae bacterium]|jgi:Predicted membrane protein